MEMTVGRGTGERATVGVGRDSEGGREKGSVIQEEVEMERVVRLEEERERRNRKRWVRGKCGAVRGRDVKMLVRRRRRRNVKQEEEREGLCNWKKWEAGTAWKLRKGDSKRGVQKRETGH